MYFKTTYEPEFEDLYMYLKSKYPQKLFDLEGIGIQTDMGVFSKNFFGDATTTADASVDANSNVDDMTVVAYENELPKPFTRMNSLYLLWKYGKKLYGHEFANQMVERELVGEYYINDLSNVQKPYCFNFSAMDVMSKGLPFVKKINSLPAKHLSSFCGQMVHFTSYASNQVMGAVGIADLLIVMSFFVKKEIKENSFVPEEYIWRQVKQEIQSLIYSMNQPFRGGLQSGFYNVSVYDDYFLESLHENYLSPDGEEFDITLVKKLQDIYLDLMNETMEISPITFPVTTACFCVDKERNIMDENFLNYIAQKNQKWGFINIYAGESSTLSSCCFSPDTKILAKSSSGAYHMPIKEFHELPYNEMKANCTVFHNGSWVRAKSIKLPADRPMYEIITTNNKKVVCTDNHIFPTLSGDKEAKDLTSNDYLLFNTRALHDYPERGLGLTYEQGYVIGSYLGDGSTYMREGAQSEIVFSLNQDKLQEGYATILKGLKDFGISEEPKILTPVNNCYPVRVYSDDLKECIFTYISGHYCNEKHLLPNVFIQSKDFRRGILDGLYMTDGGNSNRIYTTSEQLQEDIECLCTTLGLVTIVNVSNRTNEPVVFRGKTFNRNFPLYCVRWYAPKNKRSMQDVFLIKNNCMYFKIKEIKRVDNMDIDGLYCFECKNQDEPYFTLPNGIITHNCRLRSNRDNQYLGYANSFGSGSTQIGSFGVVTLNVPHIALKAKGNKEEFFKELEVVAQYAIKINDVKRHILKLRIDKHALPLYDHGFMNLQKQYATIGINGLYEAIEILGENIVKPSGQELCKDILNRLNDWNDEADAKYGYAHNVEQTPSENSAIKLAQKDKLLGLQQDYKLYSNQFIPLIATANMLDRIYLQGMFDSQFSGGSILHINCDSRVDNYHDIAEMIKATVKSGCVYHAINYNLQKCENGHMNVGKYENCAICGAPISDNYIRVVGFVVNVKNFHKVRREEDYAHRQFYSGTDVAAVH